MRDEKYNSSVEETNILRMDIANFLLARRKKMLRMHIDKKDDKRICFVFEHIDKEEIQEIVNRIRELKLNGIYNF